MWMEDGFKYRNSMEAHHALRSLSKKRTTNFREDETKLLIQLWGSPQIQNKLYLTHRKEPVMRILAHNMQQRGFYRTPDEIKTRIRNLKCLYHRIKRTVQSGAGIGTVDPDWPHFKAMDRILSSQNQKKENMYRDNVFEGPRCEDIKQEIDDIDVKDDLESYTSNSLAGSEYEEEQLPLPPLTPAPTSPAKDPARKPSEKTPAFQSRPLPKILPNLPSLATIPIQGQANKPSQQKPQQQQTPLSSLPFPLLILNGLQTAQAQQSQSEKAVKDTAKNNTFASSSSDTATALNNILLKQLLEIQKENLDIERKRLELEKQRLDFEQFVAHQLLAMGPVFSGLLQRAFFPDNNKGDSTNSQSDATPKNERKRSALSNLDFIKESKILRTLLNEGIKNYIIDEDNDDSDDNEVQTEENSNSSQK